MVSGFRSAVAVAGVEGIVPPEFDLNTPHAQMSTLIKTRLLGAAPPDGWICPGEICAMATSAALQDAGLTPGMEVGVVAKQTSRVFDLFRPRLDTIYEDISEAGRGMAHALLAQLGGDPCAMGQVLQAPVPDF